MSIREAENRNIAEAEKQEPVTEPIEDMVLALRGASGLCTEDAIDALRDVLAVLPLYTHPQPKRKPLTEEKIAEISVECAVVTPSDIYFARAIEAAHNIKEKK